MADYYTLLTNAGIAYETACKAAGTPIKLTQISVGDGGGTVYNPAATATALKREVWRGPLNALFQDEKNPSWLLAEVTIPPDVGGWYVREAGLWTDTGILYAIVKYPESFKPVLATSGSGKEFYIRSIFETSNASLVTLLIDDTVVKATRAWVADYVADELAKLDAKQSVRVATTANIVLSGAQTIDGRALVAGDRCLVKNQVLSTGNGLYVVANGAWSRATDANSDTKVTPNIVVVVEEGLSQADTMWQLITDGPIALGTTALIFQNITNGFARLLSPAFAGNPSAPTAVQFDSSNSIATTGFVKRTGVEYSSFSTLSVSTNLSAIHVGGLHSFSSTTPISAVLPRTTDIPQAATITLICAGTGGLNVVAAAGDVVFTSNGTSGSLVMALGDSAEFIRLENQWRLIGGTLALRYAGVMAGAFFNSSQKFDSSTRLATTEFVQNSLGNYSNVNIFTSSTSLMSTHFGRLLLLNAATPMKVTLPPSVSGVNGATIVLRNVGSAPATIVTSGSDQIATIATNPLPAIVIQPGSSLDLVLQGVSYYASGTAALKFSSELAFNTAETGFAKQPSGMIEQWGTGVTDADGYVYLTFPVAFPTAMRNISILHVGSLSVMTCLVVGTSKTTGCTVRLQLDARATSASWMIQWRALGV
jgi:hypothetical protein